MPKFEWKKFEALCKQQGLSKQESIAGALQINQSQISRWKKGLTTPDRDTLWEIAVHFGVPPVYFFEHRGSGPASELENTEGWKNSEPLLHWLRSVQPALKSNMHLRIEIELPPEVRGLKRGRENFRDRAQNRLRGCIYKVRKQKNKIIIES
jgi:transcriptional regulator with XRE-family HTH domain